MGGDLSLAGVSGRCVARDGSDLEVGWLSGATSVGPSRGPPRTGHWASGAPGVNAGPRAQPRARARRGRWGGEAELRELGSPSRQGGVWSSVGAVEARMQLRSLRMDSEGLTGLGWHWSTPRRFEAV